jgi:hypothetical protein
MLDEVAQTWRSGAVIFINNPDGSGRAMIRPAALVFVDVDGLTWVEPSYADPAGAASPAAHERKGKLRRIAAGIVLENAEERIDVVPYDPAEDAALVGDALDWWGGYLAAFGRSFEEERERVRARLYSPDAD